MAIKDFKRQKVPIAEEVFYDNSHPDCDLESQNLQYVIDELCVKIMDSASPGFTYGDTGTVSAGSWLLNNSVPSNKTGRLIYINDAELVSVFCSNEKANTFDIEIYEHDGAVFTLLYTLSLVATRKAKATNLSIPLTTDKELAVKIVNGSAKNPVVGLQLRGAT